MSTDPGDFDYIVSGYGLPRAKEFFGEEGLLEAVASSDEMQPDVLLQRIWEAVQAFQGEASNEDDVTLLAVRAN